LDIENGRQSLEQLSIHPQILAKSPFNFPDDPDYKTMLEAVQQGQQKMLEYPRVDK